MSENQGLQEPRQIPERHTPYVNGIFREPGYIHGRAERLTEEKMRDAYRE